MTKPVWLFVVSMASERNGSYARDTINAHVDAQSAKKFINRHVEPYRRCMAIERTPLCADEDALVQLCVAAGAAACRRALEILEMAAQ